MPSRQLRHSLKNFEATPVIVIVHACTVNQTKRSGEWKKKINIKAESEENLSTLIHFTSIRPLFHAAHTYTYHTHTHTHACNNSNFMVEEKSKAQDWKIRWIPVVFGARAHRMCVYHWPAMTAFRQPIADTRQNIFHTNRAHGLPYLPNKLFHPRMKKFSHSALVLLTANHPVSCVRLFTVNGTYRTHKRFDSIHHILEEKENSHIIKLLNFAYYWRNIMWKDIPNPKTKILLFRPVEIYW